MTTLYGLKRTTADLDYYDVIPSRSAPMLLALAGRDSRLASTHRVYLQPAAVASPPDRYEDRLEAASLMWGKLDSLVVVRCEATERFRFLEQQLASEPVRTLRLSDRDDG